MLNGLFELDINGLDELDTIGLNSASSALTPKGSPAPSKPPIKASLPKFRILSFLDKFLFDERFLIALIIPAVPIPRPPVNKEILPKLLSL